MEAKYYVAARPRTNETHPIHTEGCPFLSDDEKNIYLGMFRSGKDALSISRQHFLNSSRCPFCSKETETVENQSMHFSDESAATISAAIQMPVFYHNTMFCCVN